MGKGAKNSSQQNQKSDNVANKKKELNVDQYRRQIGKHNEKIILDQVKKQAHAQGQPETKEEFVYEKPQSQFKNTIIFILFWGFIIYGMYWLIKYMVYQQEASSVIVK